MKTRAFAFVFIVVGLALGYAMARQLLESLAPYGWNKSECLITKSEVVFDAKQANACRHSLAYQYEVSGIKKTGDTWRLDPGVPYEWCSHWASFASNFPPAATPSCYVDPQNPERAVLDRGNLFSLFALSLPLCLIGVGIAIWRRKSTSFSPGKSAVKRIAQVVAGCTAVAGAVGTIYAGVLPFYQSYESKSWNKAECEVLSSGLRTSRSGSGPGSSKQNPGYYIDIAYTYAMNGRSFVSDRYDFSMFGSGSAAKLAEVTDKYSVGAKVSCSVSPTNPYEAVLVAGPASARYLWGFLPLAGVLIGFVMWFAVRRI